MKRGSVTLEGRREKIIENVRVREASGCNGCIEKINKDVFVNISVCQRPSVINGTDFWALEAMLGL